MLNSINHSPSIKSGNKIGLKLAHNKKTDADWENKYSGVLKFNLSMTEDT